MLINIRNDRFTAVADTFGGELISLKDTDNTEYLWGGDKNYWIGRSPHLFPIIGTLKDNKALIGNEYYNMNKHGFVRNSDLEIQELTEKSVTFVLRASEDTLSVYPYHFSLFITHSLEENGFITSYQIVNDSDYTMYCHIGGHVGVRCPILSTEKFEDYEIIFDRKLTTAAYFPPSDEPITEEMAIPLLEEADILPLSYNLFKDGAVIIDRIVSHSLILRNKESKKGIYFQYDGFPVLALWTFGRKQAPYLCLEPWHGLPAMKSDTSDLKDKPYCISLMPKETKRLQYALIIGRSIGGR